MMTIRALGGVWSILFSQDPAVVRVSRGRFEQVTMTKCALVKDNRVKFVGYAFKSDRDLDDDGKAMRIALGRAVKQLTHDPVVRRQFTDALEQALAGGIANGSVIVEDDDIITLTRSRDYVVDRDLGDETELFYFTEPEDPLAKTERVKSPRELELEKELRVGFNHSTQKQIDACGVCRDYQRELAELQRTPSCV